jgi:aspartyl-tRNA(Asn)/glutamyl-tRNA(Gln) amidotransferase subunit B
LAVEKSSHVNWEIVIGLETHAQLNTRSKMFSGASTAFGAAPNTQACAVDLALPGVLPVANRDAVAKAVRFGLAVNGNTPANINRRSIFARKNYFYPDLPKGYQISQYETPIVKGGSIAIVVDGREKNVRLTRAHLEEDAGKSLHEGFRDLTGIDLNRAGTPLLEIVSEPDMRSAQEAVVYAKALHALVRWIDICDGNMQEGSFRCDANVSVRPAGSDKLGTRCEIKNLNSFRFLERAIEFEAKRQIGILEDGGKIEQETRLYDAERDETRSMRTKEEAHDYRYFPDPDLLPLEVSEQWINDIQRNIGELPEAKRRRYMTAYGLSEYDAGLLTQSREMAVFFESVATHEEVKQFDPKRVAKTAANLITGELSAVLIRTGTALQDSPIQPPALAGLIALVLGNNIPISTAKTRVLEELWKHGHEKVGSLLAQVSLTHPRITNYGLDKIKVDELKTSGTSSSSGMLIVTISDLWPKADTGELEKYCDQVIAANAQQVADYRSGKEKAFNSLVGQVMKLTKGKANPQQVTEILKRKLAL